MIVMHNGNPDDADVASASHRRTTTSVMEQAILIKYIHTFFSFPDRSPDRARVVDEVLMYLSTVSDRWTRRSVRLWFNNNRKNYVNNVLPEQKKKQSSAAAAARRAPQSINAMQPQIPNEFVLQPPLKPNSNFGNFVKTNGTADFMPIETNGTNYNNYANYACSNINMDNDDEKDNTSLEQTGFKTKEKIRPFVWPLNQIPPLSASFGDIPPINTAKFKKSKGDQDQ